MTLALVLSETAGQAQYFVVFLIAQIEWETSADQRLTGVL
jgi:hypothetical protein